MLGTGISGDELPPLPTPAHFDHSGEVLVGCIESNRWSRRDSAQLFMELPDEPAIGSRNSCRSVCVQYRLDKF